MMPIWMGWDKYSGHDNTLQSSDEPCEAFRTAPGGVSLRSEKNEVVRMTPDSIRPEKEAAASVGEAGAV